MMTRMMQKCKAGPKNPTDDDRAWTFLESLNMTKLRKICKDFVIKQKGNREEVMKRVFMALKRALATSNGTWTSILYNGPGTPGYPDKDTHRAFGDWLQDNKYREYWTKVPDWTTSDANDYGQQPFCINEFARLFALLTFDEGLRKALLDSGLERTRKQLDARISREAFWYTTVAPVFNNPDRMPFVDFGVKVGDVDSSLPPLHHRSGVELRKQYVDVRGQFTFAYTNWQKSGQNEVGNFHKFCLQDSRTGNLSVMGKKCMIMFTVYGCGTANEVQDVLTFTLKTIPEGCIAETGQDFDTNNVSDARQTLKKRKADVLGRLDAISENISVLVSSMVNENMEKGVDEEKGKEEKRSKLMTRLSQAVSIRKESENATEEVKMFLDGEIATVLSLFKDSK